MDHMLPQGWNSTPLINLADYFNGAAFNEKHWSKDGLPIIRIEQINNPEAETDKYAGAVLPANYIDTGDLIFSWSATLKVVIWNSGPAVLNQHLYKVVPKKMIDLELLRHILDFNMDRLAGQSQGSTMRHVTRKELSRFKVIHPVDHRIQKKIALILQTIDRAIEQTEALIDKYQQIKAGLMHDLFTRGIGPDGQLRPPREQAPHLYQQTPIGWIPKEWEVMTIGDLAASFKGSTVIGPFGSDLIMSDYRSEGVPVIFVRDVKESGFHWVSDVFVSEEKAQRLFSHRVNAGDVLATKMGLPPCVSAVYPSGMAMGIITADMIRMTVDPNKADSHWLSMSINQDRVKRQVAAITAGVTRPKVTLSDFRKLKIATPSKIEQRKIRAILERHSRFLESEIKDVTNLQETKSGLMHDLLTGKVDIKID
jgi:type I restriction enzyme, S subunit